MAENIHDLPKGHPTRNAIARQVAEIRNIERAGFIEVDRHGSDYVRELLGVQHLFDYARELDSSNTVLDIGAGNTIAIDDLSQSSLGKGLKFEATVLDSNPLGIQKVKPDSRVHITSTEVLRGISDRSIATAIGVYSVGYSDAPSIAVGSIDRVLVQGGAFKATFYKGGSVNANETIYGFKTYTDFKKAFEDLGYDVAIEEDNPRANILLAVKQGEDEITTSAKELMEKDKISYKDQVQTLWDKK